jgi:hypothetical protein
MKKLLAMFLALLGLAKGEPAPKSDQWFVAHTDEDGKQVIIRARKTPPKPEEEKSYPWLAVISWKYRGEKSGMPSSVENQRMYALEDAIDAKMEKKGVCIQTASRTGNDRREWNYYAKNQDEFMAALNAALAGQPAFPIEIQFFEEPHWESFRALLAATK